MKGAQAVVECLVEEGVEIVFGYPGGMILPLYDALYDDTRIQQILTTHEQSAAHAADGYARASGKVGVCIATSGPGATNLVTGIATAFMDSIPLVAITGQVDTTLLGRDAFQETDIIGVTMSVTKHNFKVKDPKKLISTLRLAFQTAKSGRPGPVLVDVPRDLFLQRLYLKHRQQVRYLLSQPLIF
ncbi:Thiamine pyrophosphate enzyme, N-terminal TPP binding domain [Propionispira arboris]|uniref:Thiamine pyrophosphate enzyme, N-terminal TPP binding domain n=1 Tax=Propionispira arboris TaxID=84035 RepID=A0A1H6ZZP5_9FIRM|nr:Thiamine pyrophosphate enzyme, N-terminal TPP binding domain [Propionispira arboris]